VPTVLLVRHAQASFGAADYDVLSPTGIEQAAALAADLARRGVRVDRVVSGSLARQRDTVAPIAAAAGVRATVDARWNEYATDAILAGYSGTALQLGDPAADPRGPLPPDARVGMSSREFQDVLERALLGWMAARGARPGEETWPAFAARAGAALDDVVNDLGRGETALVCTSGGVLAAICVRLFELPPSALVAFNRVAVNAAVTRAISGRAGTRVVSFNEHAHLEGDGRTLVTYR
jgi:broad specificity phosphatase PhoE